MDDALGERPRGVQGEQAPGERLVPQCLGDLGANGVRPAVGGALEGGQEGREPAPRVMEVRDGVEQGRAGETFEQPLEAGEGSRGLERLGRGVGPLDRVAPLDEVVDPPAGAGGVAVQRLAGARGHEAQGRPAIRVLAARRERRAQVGSDAGDVVEHALRVGKDAGVDALQQIAPRRPAVAREACGEGVVDMAGAVRPDVMELSLGREGGEGRSELPRCQRGHAAEPQSDDG